MKQTLVVTRGDLADDFYWHAMEAGAVAWDIETSGLDWRVDQIGTCQVATAEAVNVVLLGEDPGVPKRLMQLLEAPDLHKVFHHAPFDLRFMTHHWDVAPRNVGCTKIASKILEPTLDAREHSLKPMLLRHLGVEVSKDEQVSDWLAQKLTDSQLRYAATDVAHLLQLEQVLIERCRDAGVYDLVTASWTYLPTRAVLDVHGIGDVFTY